jgi:hypothetical protein
MRLQEEFCASRLEQKRSHLLKTFANSKQRSALMNALPRPCSLLPVGRLCYIGAQRAAALHARAALQEDHRPRLCRRARVLCACEALRGLPAGETVAAGGGRYVAAGRRS